MIWAFQFGDVVVKPSNTETALFLAGTGAAFYGGWEGKPAPGIAGALVAAAVGWRMYEKAKEVQRPELMNGYFITGGRASAMRSDDEAEEISALLGF